MRSAWGVEHGGEVSKTYIPGKGFVSASTMSKDGLKLAQAHHPARYRTGDVSTMSERGKRMELARPKWKDHVQRAHDQFRDDRGRYIAGASQKTRADGTTYNASTGLKPEHFGVAVQHGGKRVPGQVFINANLPESEHPAKLFAHESAHIRPKRTSWRMAQIGSDELKAAREEARADFESGTYYRNARTSTNGYTQGARARGRKTEFSQAYRDAQDKMAAAKGPLPRYKHQAADYQGELVLAGGAGFLGAAAYADHRKKGKLKKVTGQ